MFHRSLYRRGLLVSQATIRRQHIKPAVDSLERRRLLTAIASDQTLTASLASATQILEYEINANAGGSLSVALAETAATGFTPRLQVLSPAGVSLYNSSDSTGLYAVLNNLPLSGEYKIRVSDSNGNVAGSFRMTAARISGVQAPNDSHGGAITNNQRKLATVLPGDLDVYTFDASVGDSVQITFADQNSSAFYPRLSVYSPTGALVASSNDGQGLRIAQASLGTTGTYFIVASDYYGVSTGDYAIAFSKAPGAVTTDTTDNEGGNIASGERRIGTIATADIDVYRFTANTGASLSVTLSDLDNTNLYVILTVYTPSGSVLGTTNDSSGSRLTFTNLTASGTYTIVVSDYYAVGTGRYALSLANVPSTITPDPADPDGGVITSGQRRRGRIELGDIDLFTFTAGVGNSLMLTYADLTQNGFYPLVHVYAPNGSVVASSNDSSGARLHIQNLAVSGTYTITIQDYYASSTGEYALGFARTPAAITADPKDPDGGALLNGQRRIGTLPLGDLDIYTFTANIGDGAVLDFGDIEGTSFYPTFHVYSPGGTQIASTNDSVGSTLRLDSLAVSGTYYVVVGDYYGTSSGRYALALSRPGATFNVDPTETDGGAIASGSTRYGALPIGDNDLFTASLSAGVSTTVRLREISTSAGYMQVFAYGPSGQYLGQANDSALAEYTFTPTASGTYSFVAVDYYGSAVSNYAFTLNAAAPTADTVPPAILAGTFDAARAPQELRFRFSEPVQGSADFDDVTVRNTTTNETVPVELVASGYVSGTFEAVFTFPGYSQGILPDGNYTATYGSGNATDLAGNPLAAATVTTFFVLAGDLNRDRRVDFDDLLTLSQNYGGFARTFGEGNIDYSLDGYVGFDDLLMLSQQYGKSLLMASTDAPRPADFSRRRAALVDDLLA